MADDEVTEAVKKMLDEPIAQCSKTGLAPFYTSNKPPAVRSLPFVFLLIRLCFNIALIILCLILQAKDSFWKRKTSDKPVRAPRPKSRVTKTAIKHGSTVKTPCLLTKTLCRVTVPTGLAMAILCLNVLLLRNDRLMHLKLLSSGPS